MIIEGYIKTNFAEMRKLNQVIGCGSITDGNYKMEVRVSNFNYDDYLDLEITKGDKIQIIGSIYNAADSPYLIINDIHDIKKLGGHLPLSSLLNGTKTPKKRELEEKSSSYVRMILMKILY
ncbi:uncharacterized protein LOC118647657 [Monomorium pharaonis]|uniref:uncharacterized protein LOC118647657 n=1 Tax=Monomorium pharaonis TaxID=307658 RepID=UPI001747ACE4|nr:uncharacterized protein LOC118647657 [Monomorium pharaonis]